VRSIRDKGFELSSTLFSRPLKSETKIFSVERFDEAVQDIASNQNILPVSSDAAYGKQFIAFDAESNIIDRTVGESAIVTASPQKGFGGEP